MNHPLRDTPPADAGDNVAELWLARRRAHAGHLGELRPLLVARWELLSGWLAQAARARRGRR